MRSSVRSRLAPPGGSRNCLQDETKTDPAQSNLDPGQATLVAVFDIVNGFLIDAVAHGGRSLVFGSGVGGDAALTDVISG